jgi:pimeloyl-ACP methyl ester carboxylesterase
MNTHTVKKESRGSTQFLILPDGRELAYHLTDGSLPGVVFMGGFRSDMTGSKAVSLEAHCRARKQRFLRFDYTGHGKSSGEFTKCHIGDWKSDALAMLDHVATGPNILAGSSMGGWIMLLAALERKELVRGLIGIASAPDFTENLIWQTMSQEQKKNLMRDKNMQLPSCNGQEPYTVTLELIEEARDHLMLTDEISLDIPVRLIHGLKDEDVPWQTSQKLLEALKTTDVTLQLIKNAGHRMSDGANLVFLNNMLDALMDDVSVS